MAPQRDMLPPDSTWVAFQQRHPGHPWLQEDPLYTLSETILEAIKSELPDFFTAEQEAFERDLARSTRQGFFLRRAIDTNRAGFGGIEEGQVEAPRQQSYSSGRTIAEFLAQLRALPGSEQHRALDQLGGLLTGQAPRLTDQEAVQVVQEFLAHLESNRTRQATQRGRRAGQQQSEHLLRRRQEAYAGWLILSSRYRTEVKELQQQCGRWVVMEGQFPYFGGYSGRPAPPGERRRGSRGRFVDLYQRWGLDRLLTWELPQPLDIVHCEVSELAGQAPPFDGVALLIPWPMLRGEQVDFQASLTQLREERRPAHLVDWLTSEQESEEGTAQVTYQWLFVLYRVYELVLFRRYQQACKGRLHRLDSAIASVLGRNAEVVRKQRHRLRATLHSAR